MENLKNAQTSIQLSIAEIDKKFRVLREFQKIDNSVDFSNIITSLQNSRNKLVLMNDSLYELINL